MGTRITAANRIQRLSSDKWHLFKAEMSQAKRGIKNAMCLELVFAVVAGSCFVGSLVLMVGVASWICK